MVGNHHFESFWGHQEIETGMMWPKIKSFWQTHQVGVHSKTEVDQVTSDPLDG